MTSDTTEKAFQKDIINYLNEDTYSKIAKLNSTNDSEIVIGKAQDFDTKNFTKEFLKENGITEGEELRAYYDKDTKTTLINPKYKAEFYEIIAHENLSHAILDTNENVRKQLIDKISKNEKLNALFHKNDAEIKKLYAKQGENVVNSERLASFLENFIKDQTIILTEKGVENAQMNVISLFKPLQPKNL